MSSYQEISDIFILKLFKITYGCRCRDDSGIFFNFQFSTINAQCVHTILFYGF